jgi:hypothetical protein
LKPKDVEWDKIYAQADALAANGIISFSDALLIREMTSLTQARKYIAMLEKRHSRDQQQNSMALQQQNADVQNQSIKAKLDADKEMAKFKHDLDMEIEDHKRGTLEMQFEYESDKELRALSQASAADRSNIVVEGAEDRAAIAAQATEDRELERIKGEQRILLEKSKPKTKAA